ncbi:MAG: T9SS type A sorting domain-containing protein, partial [Bacteroidota bacterium]|nr:T9SS type A sorting domain-containing protein [Bacteroidota bacterium]
SGSDELQALISTTDGGYLIGGRSNSVSSGDKSQGSLGEYDYWILKTDNNGNRQWDERFGGDADEDLRTVLQTTDGGYLLAGRSASGISGNKTQSSQGRTDYWLVKVPFIPIKIAPAVTVNSTVVPEQTPAVEPASRPKAFHLETFPNPFSDKLTIRFTPLKTENVNVKIYNSQGIELKTLYEGQVEESKKVELSWSVTKEMAGLYVVRFVSASTVTSQKVLLRK